MTLAARSDPDPSPALALRILRAEREARLRYDWRGIFCPQAPRPWAPHFEPGCRHARPEQLEPDGDWFVWFIQAGRGWGKTRTGAEYVRRFVRHHPGSRAALVASTFADGRDTMVEGESGLLTITPPAELRGGDPDAAWNRSTGELYFANGSRARIYSSEKPRQLRGPQHHVIWGDEPAYWLDAPLGDAENTTWSNAKLGLRLGADPRAILTSTPRPVRLLIGTADQPGILQATGTVVTRGTSEENIANLAPTYRLRVIEPYRGTRLGRQELEGEILEDTPGALWTTGIIHYRPAPAIVRSGAAQPDLRRVAIGIDPNASDGADADEAGIVAMGLGPDGAGYVLADRSTRGGPSAWAARAIQAADDFRADEIIAEANNGGEMVRLTLRVAMEARLRRGEGGIVPIRLVTASRGKRTRAEPVAMLYEQGRIFHAERMPDLEWQLTHWTPESGDSPDRLDALVWVATRLMLGGSASDDSSFSLVA